MAAVEAYVSRERPGFIVRLVGYTLSLRAAQLTGWRACTVAETGRVFRIQAAVIQDALVVLEGGGMQPAVSWHATLR